MLSITTNKRIDPDAKQLFSASLAETYAEVMDSETGYLAVKHDSVDRGDLWLGRAGGSKGDVVLLEADVRAGRSVERRRAFVLEFIETVHEKWDVPASNVKVVFTEHDGTHMMGHDRVGGDWKPEG
ncbi:4-oxalocrotonate tautomerase [Halalkaliarchaeum desulfuricum]|uniref:4-oxalocrotonate tautomerase n=1 Tax=Halalkaliarchaeum desulfuricum TaxID=2055893 RepID=A0A343TJB0_9EURY|nr:4-oxalocrotonate tautomerase [Halalkaliarchaeum desulfuricum]